MPSLKALGLTHAMLRKSLTTQLCCQVRSSSLMTFIAACPSSYGSRQNDS